jgi:hypothetical protein
MCSTISILIPVNILILTLKMLHLAVKLVPPLKGSRTASMKPRKFLQSPPVQEELKRTLAVDFDPNELLLDPTPQEDHTTIEKYHKDVSDKLGSDRKELQVLLPFGKQWHIRQVVSNTHSGQNRRVRFSSSCTEGDCKNFLGCMLAVLLPFKGGTNFTAKCNILSVNIRMLTGISMPMVER